MNIAQYAIQNKVITVVMTLVLLVGGAISYTELSRLEDPEFTIKEALVVTSYPGATPEEVEQEVTDLLETEIQRMGQIKEIASVSKAGLSIITVTMKDKYDKFSLPGVWEQLRRKVHDAQRRLPPGAGASIVRDDFGDVFGVLFAITGDGYTDKEIYEYAKFLRRELLLVSDVAKVDLWGVQQEAIYVEFSRARLAQFGISQAEVYRKLHQQNTVVAAGHLQVGRDYVRIDSPVGIGAVRDIENLILRESGRGAGAKLIYLRDVARVNREYVSPPEKLLRFNGAPAVSLAISTVEGGNVAVLGAGVMARLAELRAQTPVGLEVQPIYMQPDIVADAIGNFTVNLMQAIVIVVVVLLVFMGLRSGLIIGAVLVITVVATFILMQLNGVALERVSLGALVIALGMLVDNAIVVTEGMLVRIQSGMERMRAAREAVGQTVWPLCGATVIAILAFAAIGLSEDATGEFCLSLFQVMAFSLTLSWITAITITPLLCYWLIPGPAGQFAGGAKTPYDGPLFIWYRQFLEACLHRRWLTLGLMAVLLSAAVYGFSQLKGSFFPKSTMPKFMIHYWLPEGADIRTTIADVQTLEASVLDDERVASVASFIGEGAPRFILTYSPEKTNSSYAFLLVSVKDYHDIGALMAQFRTHLAENFPDAEPKLQRFNLGPSPDSSFEVRISGPDPVVLRSLSERVKGLLNEAGAAEIRDDWRQRVKVVRPVYAERQAQFAGIDRADLNEALQTNFSGVLVGLYREDDELIPIYSRAPAAERLDAAQIGNVQVWSPVLQSAVQIHQVVSGFETGWENAQVQRFDRKRAITVGGEPPPGQLPSELFERMRPGVETLALPLGYSIEWGGEHDASADAKAALGGGIPAAMGLMVLITIFLFNSLRHPLIIWLTVPLAVIGVTAGLWVSGEPFGFMPLLGFLSLSGMLIKNAIVLIDQINLTLIRTPNAWEGVLDASVSRCRPVLMAAGTTALGMIPLLGDDFFVGMAVAIMAGLLFASVLTLVVVPVFYTLIFRVQPDAEGLRATA